MNAKDFRKGIFISYSHRDRKWLDCLTMMLKPIFPGEKIEVWDDTKIAPGASWQKEIETALARARVAVLLVSPDFLASSFITNVELPAILRLKQEEGTAIFWIPVRSSAYKSTVLAELQAASDPSRPLDSLPRPDREKLLVEIAEKIGAAANVNRVANSLAVIDEFGWQAEALANNLSDQQAKREYSVTARQKGATVQFERGGQVFEQITSEDMSRLSEADQQLIRAHERAMQELFDRWTELYPKRHAEDEILRARTVQKLQDTKNALCSELNVILDFIESMGKQLQDHYQHVRYICTRNKI